MKDLKPVSFIVLGLVEQATEATPYELKQMAGAFSGLWALRHDQVYREPERLAKAGLLSEDREQGGRRRRRFRLTDAGRKALEAWRSEPTAEFTELRDPGLLQLLFGGSPERLAAVQLEAHEARLTEYQRMAEEFAEWSTPGARRALNAGIGHEREWVRFWKDVKAGGDGG